MIFYQRFAALNAGYDLILLLSVLQDRIHSTNAWGEGDLLVSNGKNDGCWPNEFGPTTAIYRLDQGKSQIFNPLALINPAIIFNPRFAALNAGYDLILLSLALLP